MEVTVLFADLSGFTALTEVHGDDDAADLAERFYELTRAALQGDARLVKTIGDAVMVVGARPGAVVAASLRLAQAAESEPSFPALRTGLHVGPVTERADDVFGATVNIAARVAAHARAGQVLCTAAVARALAEADLHGLQLLPLGSTRFKNVSEPVELFELLRESGPLSRGVLDPVCRMQVDPATAPAHVQIDGQTYSFCSSTCAQAFARAQASYRR